ncbi:hypothetical protein Tco_0097765 [Tanacetum coccineum]
MECNCDPEYLGSLIQIINAKPPRSANAKHSSISGNSARNQELAWVSKFLVGPTGGWKGAVLCEQKGVLLVLCQPSGMASLLKKLGLGKCPDPEVEEGGVLAELQNLAKHISQICQFDLFNLAVSQLGSWSRRLVLLVLSSNARGQYHLSSATSGDVKQLGILECINMVDANSENPWLDMPKGREELMMNWIQDRPQLEWIRGGSISSHIRAATLDREWKKHMLNRSNWNIGDPIVEVILLKSNGDMSYAGLSLVMTEERNV